MVGGFYCLPVCDLTRFTAVILLDELEKAHKVSYFYHSLTFVGVHTMKDVSMILLQILDEGSITDSQGRKVDFKVGNLSLSPGISNLVHP